MNQIELEYEIQKYADRLRDDMMRFNELRKQKFGHEFSRDTLKCERCGTRLVDHHDIQPKPENFDKLVCKGLSK